MINNILLDTFTGKEVYNFLVSLLGNEILASFALTVLPLTFLLVYALYAIWGERKVSAHMQDRLGPMITGYHGLLQTIADLLKLLQKEQITGKFFDKGLFNIAPYLMFAGSFMVIAVVPFSSAMLGSDIELGLLFFVAASSFVVASILMAGWASNNKYSLLGAMRSVAQIVSYEIPTILVILTFIMITGTLSLRQLSELQTGHIWNWYLFGGPEMGIQKFLYIPFMFANFIIIYISSVAEVNRTPFDLPEAESELVAGYSTEYSGMRWGMFMLGEYVNMFTVSILVASLFLGGYQSPIGYLGNTLGIEWLVPVEQFFWFAIKGFFFVFVQMWLRWTLPRLRVDQLMAVCWKYLIPIAFVNLIIIGLITLL